MKRIATLTLLGIVLSPVSATANSEPDSITVTGRFVGIAPEGKHSVIINECDISDKSVRRFVEFDSSGYFSEKIPFYYGHTFTIVYDRSFINAYAEPSDSIHIEADVSCSPFEFHISGDHATLNEEFSHVYRDLSVIYYDVSLPSPKLLLLIIWRPSKMLSMRNNRLSTVMSPNMESRTTPPSCSARRMFIR